MIKHILITGSADGLGWALAQQYWQLGYHVHLLDRDGQKLSERAQQFPKRCSTYTVDLLDAQQLSGFCQAFSEQHSTLDILVHNAGITHRSKGSVTDLEVFDRVMTLNWQVPVHITRSLLPQLKKAQGKILCLASMAALMPVPGRAAYCASKSALNQHFETWRPELLNDKITLLMIFPSFVATNIEQNALGANGKPTQQPQSKVGSVMTPAQMSKLIVTAQQNNKQRLYSPQFQSRLGFWLWTCMPKLFQRISWRKFSGDID
ncbi:SDR family NAD(P)-dependent oxidoreductase [uncultured Paraglaciecola sp.]|uniref:SDR family NAD(P)-dependent oxidoreductase n=1 Tax=uncultured Paraglaciecola sp. TaxID=1765024 RepID=UPI00260F0C13|nr:SDR family NAD(P)-dependent oxidoreductase [uncultured Paraglaciecola sp.]